MKRRNFILGAGAAAAGGSALLGTGAFSRVESQRSVTIEVAEDPDAYLGLDKCDSLNGSYAHLDGNGHLEILMNEDNPHHPEDDLGAGVNSNSRSWFDRVFQICNQGKEPACVYIEDDDAWPRVPDGEPDAGERRVEFYLEDDDERSLIGQENAIGIPLGECVCVGIKTRTFGLEDGDELLEALDNNVTIVADVDEECGSIPGEITETGRVSLAYEDLPPDDNRIDWDYNDWVVDIFGTFRGCGAGGREGIEQFVWDIVPQARLAGDSHKFEFEFDCGGEYTLTYYDADGDQIGSETDNFTAGEVDITIWDDTSDVVDTLAEGDFACVVPDEWAQLEVNFEGCCDFDTLSGPYATHGDDLPFNPILDNNDTSITPVGRGDIRLLVVNEEWQWPGENVPIWDAYEDVDEGGDGKPVFNPGWEDTAVSGQTVDCDISVGPGGELVKDD